MHDKPQLLSSEGRNASGAFFTKDQEDIPVLVWTEQVAEGSDPTANRIHFAKWNAVAGDFGKTKVVQPSEGCRAHDESMSKLAFKADGTIVAVFSKRTPTPKNRFAGALYYTQSFDAGNTWTAAKYLHVGDTTHGLSRSFFDLAMLPDGEVGAIWLDSRMTKQRRDGSSLFFAKTQGRQGFLQDQLIGTGTCECCRTELLVAENGGIHAAYRDIWQDSIRDMSLVTSWDNGKTFSAPQRWSTDDWIVHGCPHTGPSLASTADALHYVWFTMGGGQGIYYSTSDDKGNDYTPRTLVTEKGRHPQLIATDQEQMVLVWDENSKAGHAVHDHHNPTQAKQNVATVPTSYIKAQVWEGGNPVREHWVSAPTAYAEFPVVADLGNHQMGIAWVQDIGTEGYGVYFRRLER
ncbi:MAG: hypothetical protein AAF738_03190 [Bacteroidota bacterium]